jgi:hypothetical protein
MKSEIMIPESFDVIELDETQLNLVIGGLAAPIEGNYKCTSNSGCNTVAGCGGTAS